MDMTCNAAHAGAVLATAPLPSWVLAMAMMEAWATADGWKSTANAIGYLATPGVAKRFNIAAYARGFTEAAARLDALVPSIVRANGWTLREILSDACAPFGRWIARDHDTRWPDEPVWRTWLQKQLTMWLLDPGTLFDTALDLVVPARLRMQGVTRDGAALEACRRIDRAVAPGGPGYGMFTRYWLVDDGKDKAPGSQCDVHVVVETAARSIDGARAQLLHLLTMCFGDQGTDWDLDAPTTPLARSVPVSAVATPDEQACTQGATNFVIRCTDLVAHASAPTAHLQHSDGRLEAQANASLPPT